MQKVLLFKICSPPLLSFLFLSLFSVLLLPVLTHILVVTSSTDSIPNPFFFRPAFRFQLRANSGSFSSSGGLVLSLHAIWSQLSVNLILSNWSCELRSVLILPEVLMQVNFSRAGGQQENVSTRVCMCVWVTAHVLLPHCFTVVGNWHKLVISIELYWPCCTNGSISVIAVW